MTCRFEVSTQQADIQPEGTIYQVVVGGDAFLPNEYHPYIKVFIDLPVGPDSPVGLQKIKDVMTSKTFYTQIRQAFNPITR